MQSQVTSQGSPVAPSLANDTTWPFTITLVMNPFAAIDSMDYPATAPSGASISITAHLRNSGTGTGVLKAKLVDRDTATQVGSEGTTPSLAPGGTAIMTFTVTMPTKNWNLQCQARHNTSIDAWSDFTITLVTAAFATITSVTAPGSATNGANVMVDVFLKNTGNGTGILKCRILDVDSAAVVGPEIPTSSLAPNGTYQVTWDGLTMPNHDWHLRAEAYH